MTLDVLLASAMMLPALAHDTAEEMRASSVNKAADA